MPFLEPDHADYAVARSIADEIANAAGGVDRLKILVGDVVRDAIDGVIKSPKTGRRFYAQLQNSEKTYIGTCVEVDLRAALGIRRGTLLDLNVAGREVDVKFSGSTAWMIPPEAFEHPCVLISANDLSARVSMGVFVAHLHYLSAPNRDRKRGITAGGRANAHWMFENLTYPPNFWQSVSDETAAQIADGATGNARMAALFRAVLDKPIPRKIVEDVARQKDFMRRMRADGDRGTRNILAHEGVLVLSGVWNRDRALIQKLKLPNISRDQFLAHRLRESEIIAARAAGFPV